MLGQKHEYEGKIEIPNRYLIKKESKILKDVIREHVTEARIYGVEINSGNVIIQKNI